MRGSQPCPPPPPCRLSPPCPLPPGMRWLQGPFEPRAVPAGRHPGDNASICLSGKRMGLGGGWGSASLCCDLLLCSSHGGLEQNRAGYCLIKAELLIAQTTCKAQFLLEDLGPYRDRFFPLHKKKETFPSKKINP